ncbi:MAG: hypothetical protein ACRETT_05075 [Steroidobacteraceae bacterium]
MRGGALRAAVKDGLASGPATLLDMGKSSRARRKRKRTPLDEPVAEAFSPWRVHGSRDLDRLF